jgi:hypothetical protein
MHALVPKAEDKYTIYGQWAVSTRVSPACRLEPNKKRSLLSCHFAKCLEPEARA